MTETLQINSFLDMASLSTTIKKYEHWFHYGTFVHEPLKASLLDVFHNVSGLPRDAK